MFKFLLVTIFFFSIGSFSDPQKSFPTPEGFTVNPAEEWSLEYFVPHHIVKRFGEDGALRVNELNICASILQPLTNRAKRRGIKSLTYRMNNILYNFGAGSGGSSHTRSPSGLRSKVHCSFRWAKNGIIDSNSPIYYIKK